MKTFNRSRLLILAVLVATVGVLLAGAGPAGGQSGASVAQKLSDADSAVGGLSGAVGPSGAYDNDNANAKSVPFLSGEPGSLLPDLFDALGPLSGFDNFSPNDDDSIKVVMDKVDSVDTALGGDALHPKLDPSYICGDAVCTDSSKVKDLTSIELGLGIGGSKSDNIDFTTLGLPSLGFLPKDAQQLKVDLSWSINLRLVVDSNGVHLAPVSGQHALDLGAAITLPTDDFKVDLGALIVNATTKTQPSFSGHLLVDLKDGGGFDFGFSPDSGFHALWHLQTDDKSPLKGIQGDLHIDWNLGGAGVKSDGLSIEVDDVRIDTSQFVGKDMQKAAASLREITHPIRTATSTLTEPIPGLSDLASALPGGGDVTMLRLMEQANGVSLDNPNPFPKADFEKTLERLQELDDITAALKGGGTDVPLGSFKLVGTDALTPKNEPFGEQVAKALGEKLDSIYKDCGDLCQKSVDQLLTAVNGAPTPGQGGFQFDVPVLNDPASLAGMLLGRDVDLIKFDTGDTLQYKDKLNIPLARFLIFEVKLDSINDIEASIDLKGGVDTRGIADALLKPGGEAADVLNGVYLQNPSDGRPVVRLYSDAGLGFAADVHPLPIGVELHGGPTPNISLTVPKSTPDDKLRPAVVKDGIGCALLEDGTADFSVNVTATFEYLIGSDTKHLAEHTFLTKKDLCDPDSTGELADPDGRLLSIRPQFDTVKVSMRHDAAGNPTFIVVTVNGNRHKDYPAGDFDAISYTNADATGPITFRAVATDGKPFEKRVTVFTGNGNDDVLVDGGAFTKVTTNDGNDNVIVTTPGALVSAGGGDDVVTGGPHDDVLGGDAGDDTVNGGGGFDILSGGTEDDVLVDSSPDGNCLSGDEGNDLIIDGPGADWLAGDEPICGIDAFNAIKPTDPGEPGGGEDKIVTGGGADHVVGGDAKDKVRLGADADTAGVYQADDAVWNAPVTVYGNGGNDDIQTGNGGDLIYGGPGNDAITSDGGPRDAITSRNGSADTIYGGLGEDTIKSGDGGDTVFGDDGTDTCTLPITGQPTEADTLGARDVVNGGPGNDRIALEAGNDQATGDDGADVICGHAGNDEITSGSEPTIGTLSTTDDDTVFGGTGTDTLNGGQGKDLIFGNGGVDTIDGGSGDDRLVGGSSAEGTKDSGDTINGGDDNDIIVGDNGSISDATPPVPSVFDLFANDATLGSVDTIGGDAGDDRAFGGIGGDTIHGGTGADHLEGNNGNDAVYGEDDQDDIIGGTSPESLPNPTAGHAAADAPDSGETILSGGAERDVVAGDNATITRPGGTDPITGGDARTVTLLDRDRTGTALAAVSGGDYIEGNEASDRLYGEGGADYIKGNEADDFAEGNQGSDRLEGNDGEDDLVGGSSAISAPGVGDPDAGDQLAGGAGADVLLGDNAAITRATTGAGTGFDWDTVANNWLGPIARRSITLLDKPTLIAGNFGADVLSGGAGADVAFGQDGDDRLYGGSHDDYLEGNGGSDVIFGDQVAAATGNPHESGEPQLDGVLLGPDGQDDEIGGSSWVKASSNGAITGQRDGADELHGDGNADVQLGDNGKVLRRIANGSYQTYQATTGKPTIVRQAAPSSSPATALPARFDVGATASAGVWGNDTLYGDGGDDLQLAEDGNDTLYGGANDDDMYGELGDDRMFGEAGEDALLGDRGVIANALVATPGAAFSVSGPPQISYTPYSAHPLDRRVDMNDDGDGSPLQSPGMTTGGADFMRGGPDHDAMHGEAGNDLMNGDSGGDYLFGDDGVDVMFGGKGRDCADPADLTCNSDHGTNDSYVDYLFGGNGLKTDPVTGGADILDFRPRSGVDPASWLDLTSTTAADPVAAHQHHQGIDWIYGGWDRDVMQADIADNGPNQGDHLLDWTGTYNLYDHCPAAYGGYNDVRQFSPDMQAFLQKLAYSLGAGKSLTDVQTKGSSGYDDLALVYNADVKSNSGSAYPTTPGHFDQFSCAP